MQDPLQTFPDDAMIDEVNNEDLEIDYNMEADDAFQVNEDEDILYEDEEDTGVEEQQMEDAVEATETNQETEDTGGDKDIDFALEDLEEPIDEQVHEFVDTNKPEVQITEDAVPASDTFVQIHENDETFQDHQQPHPENDQAGSLEDVTQETEQPRTDVQEHEQNEEYPETKLVNESAEGSTGVPSPEPKREDHVSSITADSHTSHNNTDSAEEQQLKTPHDLHPVTLVYLEEEMSLFPPMLGDSSAVYFLQDSSLAFEPLDKLLMACREILADTLDHHDELVLDVAALGLHICEDSKYAAKLTLADILDVYLRLCQNEPDQEVQPLYCHLSSRVSLASQYAYLSSACAEGKTFPEIAADHIDTPLHEDEQTNGSEFYGQPQAQDSQDAVAPETAESDGLDHQAEHVEYEDHAQHTIKDEQHESIQQVHDIAATIPGQSEGFPLSDHPTDEVTDIVHEARNISASDLDFDFGLSGEKQEYLQINQEDHETNSSHTVQADSADLAYLQAEPENHDEEAEDLFEHEEAGVVAVKDEDFAIQPEPEYEAYNDEGLFAEEQYEDTEYKTDEQPAIGDAVATPAMPSVLNGTEGLQKHSAQEHDDRAATNGHLPSSSSLEVPAALSPPVTPSKPNAAKRKMENEDELDLIDFSTPEPKRRRPS
jgi:hypothetical protein